MTRAVEERSRFVTILPNRLLKVLSCGGVVSAHLSESRHGSSLDKLKPFGGSEPEESGRLPVHGKREEAGLRSENPRVSKVCHSVSAWVLTSVRAAE